MPGDTAFLIKASKILVNKKELDTARELIDLSQANIEADDLRDFKVILSDFAADGNRDKAYMILNRAEDDPKSEYNALITRIKFLIEEERFEESQTYVGRALKLNANDTVRALYDQIEAAAKATTRE